MLLLASLAVSVSLTMPSAPMRCIDPATSLQELALGYDRWPAPTNQQDEKAFALLKTAMQSRREADYKVALNKYLNQNGNVNKTSDPHEQLALGLLYLTSYDFAFDNTNYYRHSRARYHTNAERIAGGLLPRLVDTDPHQWLAAVALARMAILTRSDERFEQARAALTKVLSVEPDNITAHLAWRDILVAQDSVAAATAYLNAHSVDCGPVMHARAEDMMLSGDTAAGSRLYLEALAKAGTDELDRFYQDLLVMANRTDLKAYDAVPVADRAKWIRDYWERNAASFGRTLETRVAEQTVRAAFADAHFMRDPVQTVVANADEFVLDTAQSLPWDLRGVIYVRHGAPLHRLTMPERECGGYEAWVYVTDGDPWVLAFIRKCDRSGPHEWQVEQKPGCDVSFVGAKAGPPQPVVIAHALARPDSLRRREIYEVLERFDPRYAELATYCMMIMRRQSPPRSRYAVLMKEFEVQRRHLVDSIQWGGTAFHQFLYPLTAQVAAYQFRGATGPEVEIITFIPVEELAARAAPIAAPRASKLDLTYTLVDPTSAPRSETVGIGVPNADRGVLRAASEMRGLTPGSALLRVFIRDPSDSTRGATRSRELVVRQPQPDLDMSDIVLAVPGASGPLVRGTFHLSPLAFASLSVGEPGRLFFEVYGVTEGVDVKETIEITRTSQEGVGDLLKMFSGKKESRTVTFSEKAHPDPAGVVYRDVEVGNDLIPGDYTIAISVSAKGRTVRRSAELHVVTNK